MRLTKCLAGALLLGFALTACQPEKKAENRSKTKYIYPGETWSKAAPEKHGFDSSKLPDLDQLAKDSKATALAVVAGGEMIWEWGHTEEYTTYIASCRKSILISMYGKYIDSGLIKRRATLADLDIDDIGGLYELEKSAKVEDILACRSGVYHEPSNGGDDETKPKRNTVTPGTHYCYNNWDFNVAGFILEQATGKTVYQLMDENLAKPMQFQDWHLDRQKYGGDTKISYYKAYHMYISTRDFARFGYLMLRKGNWNGTQLIKESWVKEITTTNSTLEEVSGKNGDFSYGYMWWLFDDNGGRVRSNPLYHGGYLARGSGGKYLAVLPAANLVIAYKNADNKGEISGMYKVIDAFLNAYDTGYKEGDYDDPENENQDETFD